MKEPDTWIGKDYQPKSFKECCEKGLIYNSDSEKGNQLPNGEGSDAATCSASPVIDIINQLLKLIREAPMYNGCRNQLEEIRDGIFLELPEDRTRLLCEVGKVINGHVPRKGVTNILYEDFWDEIKEILTAALYPPNSVLD